MFLWPCCAVTTLQRTYRSSTKLPFSFPIHSWKFGCFQCFAFILCTVWMTSQSDVYCLIFMVRRSCAKILWCLWKIIILLVKLYVWLLSLCFWHMDGVSSCTTKENKTCTRDGDKASSTGPNICRCILCELLYQYLSLKRRTYHAGAHPVLPLHLFFQPSIPCPPLLVMCEFIFVVLRFLQGNCWVVTQVP